MKPSIQKLQKIFKLEADRGYDNHAVMGGLSRILDVWMNEARADGLPEDLIQLVSERIQDYGRLTEKSRAEMLQGLWRRLQRGNGDELVQESAEQLQPTAETGAPSGITAPEDMLPFEEEREIFQPERAESISTTHALQEAPTAQAVVQEIVQPPPPVEPKALNAPLTAVRGIGERLAANLSRLGLHYLRDLLYYFPRRYDDYSRLKPINRLSYGEEVTVIGTVQNISTRPVRSGKLKITEAIVSDGSGSLRVTWFNQDYIARRLHPGMQISLAGKVSQYLGRAVMDNPSWEPLEQEPLVTGRIVPVYSLTEGIRQKWLRTQIHKVVSYWGPRIPDYLPEEIRRSAGLVNLPTAILQAHFPDSWESLQAAQQRLAFDEIFLLHLGALGQKRAWKERAARAFSAESEWLEAQKQRLPFPLTGAQHRVITEIQQDLLSGKPMNRLIQGDVGSGKTAVAAIAIAIIAHHGAQAALMAPTSILAEQHYKTLLSLLTASDKQLDEEHSVSSAPPPLRPDEICLLIGATPEGEKQRIRAALAAGTIKCVVGTHALIEDPVEFADLQLAIIDEQHRFGVEQRAALRAKGDNPHLLVMTATPIPRSLALTIYGDLDLSVIDEMPPGRRPVSTFVLTPRERERAYTLIRNQVAQGRQAFIIYPLIEGNDNNDAKAAVDEHAMLQKEIFSDLNVGLLHGRMRPDEKDAVMEDFRQGKYHILVSTTVIEVGVDVPNASVMLIEGANRFGLAQLHQLRGRVGRGAEQSYCLLIPDHPDAAENERLQVMASTNDGFVLAEKDLQQRGPGQFFGVRQSGYAEMQFANLTDIRLVEKACRFAQLLFDQDPNLTRPEHQLLAFALQQSWGGGKGDIS
ncbi:MAG: ATP-dependent DNA helicase RecG [Anaerolineales bacterium]|nr:ATP-dependent DNA helicase RecG [Anaerolineales bacterium]